MANKIVVCIMGEELIKELTYTPATFFVVEDQMIADENMKPVVARIKQMYKDNEKI